MATRGVNSVHVGDLALKHVATGEPQITTRYGDWAIHGDPSIADCKQGEFAVGGGYRLRVSPDATIQGHPHGRITMYGPSPRDVPGWAVVAEDMGPDDQLQASAICLKLTPFTASDGNELFGFASGEKTSKATPVLGLPSIEDK